MAAPVNSMKYQQHRYVAWQGVTLLVRGAKPVQAQGAPVTGHDVRAAEGRPAYAVPPQKADQRLHVLVECPEGRAAGGRGAGLHESCELCLSAPTPVGTSPSPC